MQLGRANWRWNPEIYGHERDSGLGDVLRVLDKLYLSTSSTMDFYEVLNNTINSENVSSVDTVAHLVPGAALIEFCRSMKHNAADGNATRSDTEMLQHRIAIAAFESEIIAEYGGFCGTTSD